MKNTGEVVLCIKSLSKKFGNKTVLNGIDLEVYKGQIIGYIGPNGAGKSTTVKIMLGLLDGYSGSVELFGKDISSDNYTYKRKIGYVPETAELYENLTAAEYLVFVGELYGMDSSIAEEKARKLMKEFGIEEVFHSRISSFSKGMKQKVLIISSLLHDPDLLFFDEPLSGLDANSVVIIKELMTQLAERGKTIFYSSHIMDVVEKISNRIILLVNGTIMADGSFEELKEKSEEGTLEEIFNQLTGFHQHKSIAQDVVSIISEGKEYESV
ncbi:ABC transporter ATP-binding protein [Chungangia koreensis]|uniref:ABC transporter ATP-binding protein n=1 Tax=Chungangia koreensis TaxID=752657 RepID=A0ABV8X1W7_9LACT